MKRNLLWLLFIFCCVIGTQSELFARAGGGDVISSLVSKGGGGGGDLGILGVALIIVFTILFIPVFLVMSLYAYFKSKYKVFRVSMLMNSLSATDRSWNKNLLEKRVREVYAAVQEAWTKKDMSICRKFVSDKLYDHHKELLAEMAIKGERNILKYIQLIDCYSVAVHDYKGEEDDEVYYMITGKMIDYTVNESNTLVRGDEDKLTSFDEIWVFCKHIKYGWVLDQIRHKADFFCDCRTQLIL